MSSLTVSDVTVRLGDARLVRVGTLTVPAGQVVAVVGPGGAGKSLLLRGIAGLSHLEGSVQVDAVDVTGLAAHARARRGLVLVGQDQPPVPGLTVSDCLRLPWRARRVRGPWTRRAVLGTLAGLDRVAREEVDTLGPWERRAAMIAVALRCGPRVLMLDEPAAGLTDAGVDRLAACVSALAAQGVAVLLATRHGGGAIRLGAATVELRGGALAGPAAGEAA